ncbi:MAG: hypothetical protein AAFP19_18150, partial [Bacteroidota bacterium]
MKIRCSFLFFLLPLFLSAQNVYEEPTDTLVHPNFFTSSQIIIAWEDDWCPVRVQTDGDTVFVACYTVTFKDHYDASIDLCPETINDIGGIALFNGDPRLVDSVLINDMEDDGSRLIHADGVRIHHKNLTTGVDVESGLNPDYCIEADLFLGASEDWYQSFQILKGPVDKPGGSINYHTAEPIGVLKNGIVLEHTPPSSESMTALYGGLIPLDRCGWHPEPAGFGHFHTIPYSINVPLTADGVATANQCTDFTQQNDAYLGFTFEGVPIYGPYDSGQSSAPTDLDACNGHTGMTPNFGNTYHYHASATEVINNPPCRSYYVPLDDGQFTYGAVSGLPVELMQFQGSLIEKEIKLTWQTATENNNLGFEVERSTDGDHWELIAFVAGQENSRTTTQYQYLDTHPMPNINYY